jgi:hypothetical protein
MIKNFKQTTAEGRDDFLSKENHVLKTGVELVLARSALKHAADVVEITKTGPLEKLVWALIKDPDNEIKTIHNRTEDPHPSGC